MPATPFWCSSADESIRMVNKTAQELFGYQATELLGLPLTEMLHLLNIGSIPKLQGICRKAVAGGRIAYDECRSRKRGAG